MFAAGVRVRGGTIALPPAVRAVDGTVDAGFIAVVEKWRAF